MMLAQPFRALTNRVIGALSRRLLGLEFDELLALGCGVITHTSPDGGGVALTFDDGPSAHSTLKILDILDAHDARATFFLLGVNALRHPALVREIVRRGHEVGCHSHTHPDFHWAMPWTIARELRTAKQALEDICGFPIVTLRAPYGHYRWDVGAIARGLGFTRLIGGTTAPPWDETDPTRIVDYVMSRVDAGSIIMLHDATALEPDDSRGTGRAIVGALQPLLTALASRGLTARAISSSPTIKT